MYIFVTSQKSDVSGTSRFSCKAIIFYSHLPNGQVLEDVVSQLNKKKTHTHQDLPRESKIQKLHMNLSKGQDRIQGFFQSLYINFQVYGHKPVNIEITATFPELGCHFHSVL